MSWNKYYDSQKNNVGAKDNAISPYYGGNKQNNVANAQVTSIKPFKPNCATVTGGTASDCYNTPVTINPMVAGAVAKIPVVLAELTVQINVNSIIDLPEYAWEIKDIKKHLKVTQCLLIQDTNMLFLKGFVRKNIQYATRSCSNKESFCGDIKHCTVDVPWSCTTPVFFNGIDPLPPVPRTAVEFEYLRQQKLRGPEFADKDNLMSGDLSEFNQISTEYFNELPFCELISSRIVEFDEQLGRVRHDHHKMPFEEKQFKSIEEKMVIFLTLKVLQNRQVAIPPTGLAAIPDKDC
ncbi:CsxC family protein [Anaerosolibacter sp.]|uniref:CsxC family protein n=1 Tax=Anaerosolibacter sp. TaxID=1872527 RepID=UPI0039EF696E